MTLRLTMLAMAASLLISTPARADPGVPSAEAAPVAVTASANTDITPVIPDGGDPANDGSLTTTAAPATSGAGPQTGFALADRLVVRKRERRLLLFSDDRVVAEYPIRLGLNPVGAKEREGDFRTPEGSYQLTRRNQFSDFFLSIGLSYPNDSDLTRARRQRVEPGGAIMIHGQPNFPRKPPEYYVGNDWTDGCIAVSNSDMVDIWLRTRNGLPIEIRP